MGIELQNFGGGQVSNAMRGAGSDSGVSSFLERMDRKERAKESLALRAQAQEESNRRYAIADAWNQQVRDHTIKSWAQEDKDRIAMNDLSGPLDYSGKPAEDKPAQVATATNVVPAVTTPVVGSGTTATRSGIKKSNDPLMDAASKIKQATKEYRTALSTVDTALNDQLAKIAKSGLPTSSRNALISKATADAKRRKDSLKEGYDFQTTMDPAEKMIDERNKEKKKNTEWNRRQKIKQEDKLKLKRASTKGSGGYNTPEELDATFSSDESAQHNRIQSALKKTGHGNMADAYDKFIGQWGEQITANPATWGTLVTDAPDNIEEGKSKMKQFLKKQGIKGSEINRIMKAYNKQKGK